ncbi:hypothetical protein FB566_0109 [Stackebrandtia endophytica]|uniref:AEC family transporter n=1 Tax=Stackebrandtia endophytica TaxID=1496996 RepID=A0A543APW5_9ACTN|nr:hypothetical protein FB566_0109 [Stackebrandtia endophytica]
MVLSIVAAFAPIWLITGSGLVAGRLRMFAGHAAPLTSFAFNVAMPAALFTALSSAALDRIPVRPLLAVALGTVVVAGVGFAVAGRNSRVIAAMAAGYINSGNLGIPVAFHVIGDTLLIAAVMLVQTVVITPVVLLILDTQRNRGSAVRAWLAPVRNPIVLASVAALSLNLAGVRLPAEVVEPVAVLGAAAVPVALFALGLGLVSPSVQGEAASVGAVTGVVALKVVAHPLAALLIGLVLGVEASALGAVVVIAALPTAQVVAIYAERYGASAALARQAVVWTSAVSMATLVGIALWFGLA